MASLAVASLEDSELISSFGAPAAVLDRDGEVLAMNAELRRLLGWDEGGAIVGLTEMFVSDSLPATTAWLRSGLATAVPTGLHPALLRRGDAFVPVDLALVPRVAERDRALLLVHPCEEHRSLDERLGAFRTQYRELLDATAELVIVHAIDGSILLANRATAEFVGRPASELRFLNIKDFIPQTEHAAVRERAATRVAQLSRRMYSYEVTVRSADGVEERLEANSVPIYAGDDPVAIIVIARLKDLRRREREMRDQREAAVTANRAKSEFLAHMSHEIRTPINVIFGMTEMALDTELPEPARQSLQSARSAAGTLLNLVDDVLEFSRVEARKYALRPRSFDLRERIATTLETVSTMAHSRGLALGAEVADDVPAGLVGDPDRLHQVLMNLLTNAIKYTNEGSVRVTVTRAATATPPDVHLLFSVSDTGIGIAIEERSAIFDPFKQVGQGQGPVEGTGLGLAIARELVTLLGGQIWVESELGSGSTFHFTALFESEPGEG
jgi:two-component system, sensor histidine kinase and response regulator